MSKAKSDNLSPKILNRRAFHDYHISEKLEVGIVLYGSEVKAVRQGKVSLAEGFAQVRPGALELLLVNVDIGAYEQAGVNQHEPKRTRRLLAHRRQIAELAGKTSGKGVTLIPLSMYFVRGRVKLEIGVAAGKHQQDKRQDMKKRDAEKQIQRAMTRRKI